MVDDEEPIRIALRRLLRSADFDVATFCSGAEFLESMKGSRPDCVILDLHMPQLDGFAVLAQLAKSKGRLPVVVITGHDSDEARDRALGSGALAYLSKPVDDQTLLAAISAAILHGPATA